MSVKRLDHNDGKDIPEPTQEKVIYTPEEVLFSLFAYINILFLLPLLLKQDSDFCQFHARQGIILFSFFLLIVFLSFTAGWFWSFLGTIIRIIGIILILVFTVIWLLNVVSREKKPLPIFDQYVKL